MVKRKNLKESNLEELIAKIKQLLDINKYTQCLTTQEAKSY